MRIKAPKINRVVRYFVLADLALYAGWGFMSPMFSIFVVEEVVGATLVVVGISAAIYWAARAIIQPPIAIFLDKRSGERDDFYALVGGLLAVSATAFLFTAITTVPHLYIVHLANP